jgi:hypothetical protein
VYSSQGSRELPVYSSPGSRDSPVCSAPGSWDSPVYSSPGSCFGHLGVILLILRSIQQSLKGLSFWKSSVGYFSSLGTCDLCLQKLPNLKDSNWLPGVFIAGESITNTNNSTNIRKNSKSFLDMPIGTRKKCLMKKTGHEKSGDTVPLNSLRYLFVSNYDASSTLKITVPKCTVSLPVLPVSASCCMYFLMSPSIHGKFLTPWLRYCYMHPTRHRRNRGNWCCRHTSSLFACILGDIHATATISFRCRSTSALTNHLPRRG